jgi:hypothetical protein
MNDTYNNSTPFPHSIQNKCEHCSKDDLPQSTPTSLHVVPNFNPASLHLTYSPPTYSDDELIAAFERWCRQVETASSLQLLPSLLKGDGKVISINRTPRNNKIVSK